MASKFFDLIEVTPEAQQFVERSFLIADQIKHLLRTRKMTQRALAERLGKKEAEVSRMLSGTHNFTLRTIIRLEQALEAKLFTTPHEVQTNAAAVMLHGAVTSEESIVADWKPIGTATMFPARAVPKRTAPHRTLKAAEESAAFFVLADCELVGC